MKLTEKKEKVVSLRMPVEDYELLVYASWHLGLSVSKYIRMLADTTLSPLKLKLKQGLIKYEDIKTVCDNNVQ